MSSYKNLSQKDAIKKNWLDKNTSSKYSYDPIREEKIDYDEWAKFLSYYRYYMDEFATDILGLNLFPFQKLILRAMARYPNTMLICCRG